MTGRSYLIIKIRVTVVTGLLTANLLNNGKFLWCACVFLMFLCFEAIMSHTIRQLLDLHIKFFPSQVGTSSYCKINISVFGLERVLLHLLYGLEVEQQYIETKSGEWVLGAIACRKVVIFPGVQNFPKKKWKSQDAFESKGWVIRASHLPVYCFCIVYSERLSVFIFISGWEVITQCSVCNA